MAELSLHPEALAELEAAIDWYQARSPDAAKKFADEVEHTLESIADQPKSFARYDDDHFFAILQRFPYSVVFRVHEGQLFIVAIAHASRSPNYWHHRDK